MTTQKSEHAPLPHSYQGTSIFAAVKQLHRSTQAKLHNVLKCCAASPTAGWADALHPSWGWERGAAVLLLWVKHSHSKAPIYLPALELRSPRLCCKADRSEQELQRIPCSDLHLWQSQGCSEGCSHQCCSLRDQSLGLVGLYSKAALNPFTTRSEDPRHPSTCSQQRGCCHPAGLLHGKQSTPRGVNKGSALSYLPKDRKLSSSFHPASRQQQCT